MGFTVCVVALTLPKLQLLESVLLTITSVFQFGGKLICVENPKPSHGQAVAPVVTISQVVTEADLVERSKHLETTLASGQYLVFCDSKVLSSQDKAERELWSFLKV